MSASKSLISGSKSNSLVKCDHKEDIRRLEEADKRIHDAETLHWEQLFKKFVNWGPEKFNIITDLKNNYSLFPFTFIHQETVDEKLSGTWSLSSNEAVLLINDLQNLLAQLSKCYVDADTDAKSMNAIDYKSRMVLDKLIRDFDVHFKKICEIDAVCNEIYVLTEIIHKTTLELLSTSKNFDDIARLEDQQQNTAVILDQLYPEQCEKTQMAVQKCNEGLKLLDKCEFILNEAIALQNIDQNCNDGKPVWSKIDETFDIEMENRRLYTHTGAIPKAYRSNMIKRKKKSNKIIRKIVDEPPPGYDLETDAVDSCCGKNTKS